MLIGLSLTRESNLNAEKYYRGNGNPLKRTSDQKLIFIQSWIHTIYHIRLKILLLTNSKFTH